MEHENIGFERIWIQQKIKSIGETRSWMKKASDTMDKLNFEEIYPLVVTLLRKSNDSLWNPIDVATSESREYEEPFQDYYNYLSNLRKNLKIKEDETFVTLKSDGSLEEEIEFLKSEILYLEENYNSEKQTIKKIRELNYNYSDFDLFEFFTSHAESLMNLIKNLPEDDRSLDDDSLFKLYFANLFAHKINGCGIEIENNQIKITQNKIDYENT